jgi:hypothetical protein
MANRQGDIDLTEAQVSAPQLALWRGLASLGGQALSIHFVLDLSLLSQLAQHFVPMKLACP